MNIDELEEASKEFFNRVIETVMEALPLNNQNDLEVKVDSNAESNTVSGTLVTPLVYSTDLNHGRSGQLQRSLPHRNQVHDVRRPDRHTPNRFGKQV